MVKPLITTKPVSAASANVARLSIASGVLFVLLLGGLHLLEPEFDPRWRFISEYALGNELRDPESGQYEPVDCSYLCDIAVHPGFQGHDRGDR